MSKRHAARAAAPEIAHIHHGSEAALTRDIDRIRRAQEQAALLITQGEEWMLPYLKRFKAELARLEETRDLLAEAAEIANHAAPDRAA